MTLPPALPARLAALGLFTLAAVSLRTQFDVTLAAEGQGSVAATLWRMAGFFTIAANLSVALAMAAVALRRPPGQVTLAAVTVAIAMAGIVYHLLLAGLRTLEGMAVWADLGLHTAVPGLMVLWWLAFAPKGLRWGHLPWLLALPAAYTAYALARGVATGFWPYPFLNADKLGWGGVAVNLAGILLAFIAAAAVLIALARRLSR